MSAMKRPGKRDPPNVGNDDDEDGLYSGYNDVTNDGLDPGELANDPTFQKAVRSSHGRRLTTTSSGPLFGRPSPAVGRVAPQRPSVAAVGSAVSRPELSTGAGRPMTAVRAAGYSSTGNRGGSAGLDAGHGGRGGGIGSPAPTTGAGRPRLEEDQHQTAMERMRRLERIINEELNASSCANCRGDLQLALEKAKEAGREHRHLIKLRTEMQDTKDRNSSSDLLEITSEVDLAFSVIFNLGTQYAANQMYSEAFRMYEMITKNKVFSKAGTLRVNMGNINFAQQHYKKAVKLYKMGLDQVPGEYMKTKVKIMGNIAVTFFKMRMYDDALRAFQQMMTAEPSVRTGFSVLLCHCVLGHRQEDIKNAFADLLKVDLKIDEDVYTPHADNDKQYELILEVIRNDDLRRWERDRRTEAENAILLAAKIISPLIESSYQAGYEWCIEQVKSSIVYVNLATQLDIDKVIGFLRQNEFKKATDALRQLERTNGQVSGVAATNLAFLYSLALEDTSGSSTTSGGGLELNASSSNTSTSGGGGTGSGGGGGSSGATAASTAAEVYAELAVQSDRYNPAALVNMGNVLYARGDLDRAREFYREAIIVDSSCVEALFNLGLTYKNQRRYGDSLQCFMKLQAMLRNNAQVLYQVADLYCLLGDTAKGVEWFIQLIGIVPSDAGVLRRLAELHDADGDRSQSFHYYSDSYRYDPNNVSVIEWLGSYFIETQFLEKAIQFFEKGVLIQPNQVRWQLMAAGCHRRAGNYRAALDLYKAAHRRFPDDVACLRYIVHLCNDLKMPETNDFLAKLHRAENVARLKEQRHQQQQQQHMQQGLRSGVGGGSSGGMRATFDAAADHLGGWSTTGRPPTAAGSRFRSTIHGSDFDSGDAFGSSRPVTAEKSEGDYEDPLGDQLVRPKTSSHRRDQLIVAAAAADDWSNEVIGDDLLPD